ncbi:MAG: putative thioesterase [Verrucomicrobiaceae bacterium]|nr:putative thioesterase [Verrucomicrobiaceae bacterium]
MNALTNLTGLELITGVIEGRIPHPSIAETIPMKIVKAAEGFVEFVVEADTRHLNPMGGVHGGFAATVMDSITGCAVHTTLATGMSYATVDLALKMIRPIPLHTKLIATGKVMSRSKSISTAEGSIKDAEGKLYAHGTATCFIKS